jgi:hypothetical protein
MMHAKKILRACTLRDDQIELVLEAGATIAVPLERLPHQDHWTLPASRTFFQPIEKLAELAQRRTLLAIGDAAYNAFLLGRALSTAGILEAPPDVQAKIEFVPFSGVDPESNTPFTTQGLRISIGENHRSVFLLPLADSMIRERRIPILNLETWARSKSRYPRRRR